MGDPSSAQQPDADTIKMFVGQIPRAWGEQECRQVFEKYGGVHTLNVLRDKQTQMSKGCCFVTFYHRKDAINAQAALHNIEVMPGMHHPVQMKPADSENRNERKLFVGMISKKLNEDDVKEMFAQFGHIEECTVLRDGDNRSKGCAFVTLSSRSCAQNAIKQMHHSLTMEGCNSPIVCKFADTTRDKDGKTKGPTPQGGDVSPALQQQQQQNLLGQLGGAGGQQQLQMLQALSALLQPQPGVAQQPNVLSLLGNALLGQQLPVQFQPAVQPQPQMVQQMAFQQQLQMQQQPALAMEGKNMYGYAAFAGAPATQNGPPKAASPPCLPPQMLGFSGMPAQSIYQQMTTPDAAYYHAAALAAAEQQAALTQLAAAAPGANPGIVGNGQSKGPDGSNLFIYHLPQEFTDADLVTTFSPFGTIISAKVFIDKQTNLSKCFGFVSFDNHLSAANAISAMNGFQIGSKRLKVQLKNAKSKPYPMGPGGNGVGVST